MNGGAAVVTGATGGIGRWIALGLADAGYSVFVIGREAARLAPAQSWIASRVPHAIGRIHCIAADLSLLSEARASAEAILSRTSRLDLLVNNAGILCPHRLETVEGHERTLAVNHLAPFVLTRALLPALREAARSSGEARVVNVGSSTSDRARIDPGDLELARGWRMVRAYSSSKLALLITSLAFADELEASRITVNVAHPGMVATGLVRHPGAAAMAWKLMAPFLLTEQQGAATPLHVALSPACAGVSGRYWKRCRPSRPNPLALDPALRARVLAATEALVLATPPRR